MGCVPYRALASSLGVADALCRAGGGTADDARPFRLRVVLGGTHLMSCRYTGLDDLLACCLGALYGRYSGRGVIARLEMVLVRLVMSGCSPAVYDRTRCTS